MKGVILQCFIVFGCLAFGELVVYLTGVSLPSSVIGLLTLTSLLKVGIVKLEWVKGIADFLTSNLAFFFIPPGVAIMLYFDIIKAQLLPILVATIVSTVMVLVITGWVHQLARRINGFSKK